MFLALLNHEQIAKIFSECRRVLKKDGKILIIGNLYKENSFREKLEVLFSKKIKWNKWKHF